LSNIGQISPATDREVNICRYPVVRLIWRSISIASLIDSYPARVDFAGAQIS
jgi:hypothetical protein